MRILILLIYLITFTQSIQFQFNLSKPDNELFNEFKLKFGRNYDKNEELKRKLLFFERLKTIRENNNNPNRLNTFGINKFTDRFDDELPILIKKFQTNNHKQTSISKISSIEFKKHHRIENKIDFTSTLYQYSLDDDFNQQVIRNEHPKSTFTLNVPGSYFSCDKTNELCGETIDQGTCGSSYAAAITNDAQIRYNYIMKYSFASKKKLNDKFSIQYLIDCGGTTGCGGGNSDETIMNTKNIYLERDYPYVDYNIDQDNNEAHDCRVPKNTPIMSLYDLTYFSNLDWDSIKTLIYNKGSFITSMYASEDFVKYYSYDSDGLGIWNCDVDVQETGTNHAVVVDGYGEDNINGEYVKYLWIRNSWGDKWGNNGHFKINFNSSCGINDKVDLGYVSDRLKGTFKIPNFAPNYVVNLKIDEINSINIGLITCATLIGLIFILFILSLFVILILSICVHRLKKKNHAMKLKDEEIEL